MHRPDISLDSLMLIAAHDRILGSGLEEMAVGIVLRLFTILLLLLWLMLLMRLLLLLLL